MQLVPNQIPPERLLSSMDAQESTSTEAASDSPFVLKGAGMLSGNGRWIYIGLLAGAMFISIGGLIFGRHMQKKGERFSFPTFIKARTDHLAQPGSAEPPAPIVIPLSPDMVRVSAIALGHPRVGRHQRENCRRRGQRYVAGAKCVRGAYPPGRENWRWLNRSL